MKLGNAVGRALVASTVVLFAGLMPACSSKGRGGPGNGGNGGSGGGVGGNGSDMSVPLTGSISIMPANVTLDLVQGMPPPQQAFTVVIHDPNGDRDVTYGSMFTVGDTTLGTMSTNTFISGTAHGGSTTVTARYTPPGGTEQMAIAMVSIRVKGSFPGPDCGGMGQPACPTFPGDNAPACAATVMKPHIVYPPDGVLLPPNMSVISVMWKPFGGAAVKAYELRFQNMTTDVRIVTTCAKQTMDTSQPTPMPSGGCEVQLSQAQWDFIAKSNRGGGPVGVTVRASADGTCATPSDNTASISFAEEDLNGGLFYWKSTISANSSGVGGEIWAKSFGDSSPETQITGANNLTGGCHGCHSLSVDGKQMTVGGDDNDSDDEYSDDNSTLVDVAMKMSLDDQSGQPGFQAIHPDRMVYVGTNGAGTSPTNGFFVTPTASPSMHPAQVTPVGGITDGQRPTMPDWSPDGKSLIFVLPTKVASWGGQNDDDHIFGGSLYTAPWDATKQTFGAATAMITSAGENNFYPSYSPDGSYVVFNRIPLTGTVMTIDSCLNTNAQYGGTCPNDSFSNPATRVLILPTKPGAMPVDVENLNGSPAKTPVAWSNSWPRWSPFVQTYKGGKLLWITFSSTRDYGLRVLNHKAGMVQCYPPDTPEWPGGSHFGGFNTNCEQPQIWMAAINLQNLELGQGDPSFPAFWLPFQDMTTHNHTAQWTQTVAGHPIPDMGMCLPNGANCQSSPNACCSQTCLGTGVCGNPIP